MRHWQTNFTPGKAEAQPSVKNKPRSLGTHTDEIRMWETYRIFYLLKFETKGSDRKEKETCVTNEKAIWLSSCYLSC